MQLQQINPDAPNVFNGVTVSYGIAPILGAISAQARNSKRHRWILYLINIETIIRDRKEKDTDADQIARGVITDCTVLAQYISTYNQLVSPNSKIKPLICFYFAKYEHINPKYLRDKFPKGTEEKWRIRDKVAALIEDEGFLTSYENTDIVFSVEEGNGKYWPHKELVKDLNDRFSGISFRSTLLVSHVPFDFHLYKVFNDFTILESYTGAFKHKRDLGKKVFGDESIPFNKYTHVLLGDKWYMKQQVDSKTKKLIKEKSKNNNWNLLPDKSILESLVDMHLPVSYDTYIKPEI